MTIRDDGSVVATQVKAIGQVAPALVEGAVYNSKTHGLVVYKGVDVYLSQLTLHFYSVTYHQNVYWLPETLNYHLEIQH